MDAVSSASINIRDGEVVGNMRAMAEVIQDLTGGDIFSIQTERSYSQNYRESTNEARAELNSDARPALDAHVEDMSLYDVVYVGYPKLEYGFNCVSCVLSGIFKSDRTVYTDICALCVCCLHR